MAGTSTAARVTMLAAVAALLLALAPLPFARDLESRIGAVLTPISAAIHDAVRPAADVLLNAGQLSRLAEENAELRAGVARLEAELSALREAGVEAEQAAALFAAVGDDAGRYVVASVVLRDPAPSRRSITVDRGTADGVAPGQPVLGASATLVGVVSEVEEHRARVRLLDDPRSAITAVVQESRTPGALAGGPGGLRLEFVPVGAPVGEGDLVLTSALGGRLPDGLLIGRITAVDSNGQDLFETVAVEPLADYARLEQVLVLTDFLPDDLIDDATTAEAAR